MTSIKSTIFVLILLISVGCKNENNKEATNRNKEIKASLISEEALLDKVQKQSIKYFCEYAEPNS